ncbi:MAG: S-layer homology domain-containing protein [Peptoniphilaceae bacterium]
MKKKSMALMILTALICMSPFVDTKAYAEGENEVCNCSEEHLPFTDVPEDSWYSSYVRWAYYEGIINGRTETKFDPNGYVTVAEVATIAAKLHDRLLDRNTHFQVNPTSPWYGQYLRYCYENGIYRNPNVAQGKVKLYACENWNAPAKRSDVAGMFANVDQRPGRALLNPDVPLTDIPDVDKSTPHHQEILTMYRMGVAVGDEWMRFNPDGKIRRNEVVALAIRLLFDDARVELPKG